MKKSAGLLMFRRSPDAQVQVLLVHPGGPFWAKKDLGAWTETGFPVSGPFLPLGSLKQPSGKTVSVWAFESDCDPAALISNKFEMEWPPRSGRKASFAEVDRAGWFSLEEARDKLLKGQAGFLDALEKEVSRAGGSLGGVR